MNWSEFVQDTDAEIVKRWDETPDKSFCIVRLAPSAGTHEGLVWRGFLEDAFELPLYKPWHCGYVAYSDNPPAEIDVDAVDVHGGVTLQQKQGAWQIFGFDCAHGGDERDSVCSDLDWLTAECERMAASIESLAAAA